MTRIVFAAVPGPSPEGIAWLGDQYRAEVVTLMLDFGQGRELEAYRDRALQAGAVRAHVLDVANEFAAQYVVPTLRAGALYLDGRPSGPGLERMVTAQKLVEVAAIEQTTSVAHAFADSERRFAAAVAALNTQLSVIALPAAVASVSSQDEYGSAAAPPRLAEAAFVELTFDRGSPTAINGVAMPLTDLVGSINMLAGAHAISMHHRSAEAARLLHDAHRGLQDARNGDQSERLSVARQYRDLIETGGWFTPARQTLDAAVDRLEANVSGTVRLQLLNDDRRIVEITAR